MPHESCRTVSARLLLLCPGQGDQHAHMFDLARTSASAAAMLDSLASPQSGALSAGPAGAAPAALADLAPDRLDARRLFANRSAQPLIVAASLAMWEAVRDFAPRPALVAGYSIGELSAYGVAGALAPAAAVNLAAIRASLMNDCLTAHPDQSLLAISSLPLDRVAPLLPPAAFHLSIETGDDACIVGGPAAALPALEAAIAGAGGRSRRLPVEVASHTPFMAQAVAPFAGILADTPFAPMSAPVLAGISASAVFDKELAVDQLSRQLAEPIRWSACMDACAEAGISVALELGPGGALSRMLQARHPHIGCRSVSDFRTLDGIRSWLERQLG